MLPGRAHAHGVDRLWCVMGVLRVTLLDTELMVSTDCVAAFLSRFALCNFVRHTTLLWVTSPMY